MHFKTLTVDPVGVLFLLVVILLMTGVIGFTPVAVGFLLLLGKIELPVTWNL